MNALDILDDIFHYVLFAWIQHLALVLALTSCSIAEAGGVDEVNLWRAKNGLKPFVEVPWMTEFAQEKAEWRAARLMQSTLTDGHKGPKCPSGCREGTGTGEPWWGWITCCMDESGKYAGAGVAIGGDGERRMVLIVHGKGRGLVHGILRAQKTAHLTPRPPIITRLNK